MTRNLVSAQTHDNTDHKLLKRAQSSRNTRGAMVQSQANKRKLPFGFMVQQDKKELMKTRTPNLDMPAIDQQRKLTRPETAKDVIRQRRIEQLTNEIN